MDSWLDKLHQAARGQRILRWFTVGLRVLLAVGFMPSGLTKVLGNRFTLLGPETRIGYFFEALYQSGEYWRFIGACQLLAALLLLLPWTATLGALAYFAIILNIFVITVAMHFSGTPVITGLMLLGTIYLICWDYDRIRHLWGSRGPALPVREPETAAGQAAM